MRGRGLSDGDERKGRWFDPSRAHQVASRCTEPGPKTTRRGRLRPIQPAEAQGRLDRWSSRKVELGGVMRIRGRKAPLAINGSALGPGMQRWGE